MKSKFQLAILAVATCFCAEAQNISGIDVSRYSGTINWQQVKAAGKTFAYVKATEGKSFVDNMFETNMTNGKQAGVIMGAVHFAQPAPGEGATQAQFFLNTVSPYIGEKHLPPALDLEVMAGQAPATISQFVMDWVEEVYKKTKVVPVVYSSGPFMAQVNLSSSLSTKCNLWIAKWGVVPNPTESRGLGPWTKWTFWQFASNGSVPGVSGEVSLDVFNGTEESFHALIDQGKKKPH